MRRLIHVKANKVSAVDIENWIQKVVQTKDDIICGLCSQEIMSTRSCHWQFDDPTPIRRSSVRQVTKPSSCFKCGVCSATNKKRCTKCNKKLCIFLEIKAAKQRDASEEYIYRLQKSIQSDTYKCFLCQGFAFNGKEIVPLRICVSRLRTQKKVCVVCDGGKTIGSELIAARCRVTNHSDFLNSTCEESKIKVKRFLNSLQFCPDNKLVCSRCMGFDEQGCVDFKKPVIIDDCLYFDHTKILELSAKAKKRLSKFDHVFEVTVCKKKDIYIPLVVTQAYRPSSVDELKNIFLTCSSSTEEDEDSSNKRFTVSL